MDGFTLTDSSPENAWVLHVAGELDAFSAPRLREYAIAGLIGRPGVAFVLDLSGVEFMDSVGLGVCTATLKRVAALSHRVAIVAATTNLQRLLARTGISRAYPVHHSLSEALTAAAIRIAT